MLNKCQMSNTKKCPTCGKWTNWNLSLEDTCEHCGELLQKVEIKRAEEKKIDLKRQEKEDIFAINPEDNFLLVLIKRGGYYIYVVVMAIVSFILGILFWLGP